MFLIWQKGFATVNEHERALQKTRSRNCRESIVSPCSNAGVHKIINITEKHYSVDLDMKMVYKTFRVGFDRQKVL